MDKGKISNIISYLQTFQLIEQLLAENIVVNKSPIEIRVPDKSFHPKDSYVFPERVFGKQNRFCNSKQFKLYPWLDYDEVSDSVTCFNCKRHHSKLEGNVEKSFTSAGYSDWKHALSSFDEHQTGSFHRLAMTYEVIVPQWGGVKEMQNESTASQMESKRRAKGIPQ